MKTLEFTAKYKLGHANFKVRGIVAARNVTQIQEIPPEVPDHADGALSRLQMPTGEWVPCVDTFDALSTRYTAAMAEEG